MYPKLPLHIKFLLLFGPFRMYYIKTIISNIESGYSAAARVHMAEELSRLGIIKRPKEFLYFINNVE
jgi:hypothetical protein